MCRAYNGRLPEFTSLSEYDLVSENVRRYWTGKTSESFVSYWYEVTWLWMTE